METVLIQIRNQKAYNLLKDLEDLQIIKVLAKEKTNQLKLSEKYAGKIPAHIVEQLQIQATQSRSEWNNQSI